MNSERLYTLRQSHCLPRPALRKSLHYIGEQPLAESLYVAVNVGVAVLYRFQHIKYAIKRKVTWCCTFVTLLFVLTESHGHLRPCFSFLVEHQSNEKVMRCLFDLGPRKPGNLADWHVRISSRDSTPVAQLGRTVHGSQV